MIKVILKRPFITKDAQYLPNPDGVSMPDGFSKKGMLPSDAKIVGEPKEPVDDEPTPVVVKPKK